MDWFAIISALFFAVGWTPILFFQANCPCCSGNICNLCSGTQPNQVQIDIAGITNGACASGSCPSLDGTYIVTAIAPSGGFCRWTTTFGSVCLFNAITLQFTAPANLVVSMSRNFPGDMVWLATGAGIGDCSSWTAFNIPWSNTDSECDNTTATATLTTL